MHICHAFFGTRCKYTHIFLYCQKLNPIGGSVTERQIYSPHTKQKATDRIRFLIYQCDTTATHVQTPAKNQKSKHKTVLLFSGFFFHLLPFPPPFLSSPSLSTLPCCSSQEAINIHIRGEWEVRTVPPDMEQKGHGASVQPGIKRRRRKRQTKKGKKNRRTETVTKRTRVQDKTSGGFKPKGC